MPDRSKAFPSEERRDPENVVIRLLTDRIDGVRSMSADTAVELSKHVRNCETMQKRVLVVVTGLLVWEVATKPEVLKLLGGVIRIVLP